ncbi:MAG: hypothetical protein K2X47_04330 [Bdellovibrionales bacterium]|nr:hypothetical protein [Bdellovibrionales bacterium]
MKTALALVATLLVTFNGQAQNRQDDDAIFTEPKKAGWTQILLGFAEALAAKKLIQGLEAESKVLRSAERELAEARGLLTSEAQRRGLINSIEKNVENWHPDVDVDGLRDEANERIAQLRSQEIVTPAQKEARIAAAQAELASVRKMIIEAASSKKILKTTFRALRIVGSTLLITDVLGRVYVWNAMDANPTLSPGAAYLNYMIKK